MATNSSSPIPTVLAFLICESLIHDAETQKKTLVGIFDRVMAGIAPAVLNLALYAKLVEGSGQCTFNFRMVKLKDESLVVQVPLQANWANAEGPFELGANFRGLVIPDFGGYEFQLYANDVYLGRAVFAFDRIDIPQSGALPK